jgi:hypothetical protein
MSAAPAKPEVSPEPKPAESVEDYIYKLKEVVQRNKEKGKRILLNLSQQNPKLYKQIKEYLLLPLISTHQGVMYQIDGTNEEETGYSLLAHAGSDSCLDGGV